MAKRRRRRRKNPSMGGWVELAAAAAAIGLVVVGNVLLRKEVRAAIMAGEVPNVALYELMIRAGGGLALLAGGVGVISNPDTTAKIVNGLGAALGASFAILPGWPYETGLAHTTPQLPAAES